MRLGLGSVGRGCRRAKQWALYIVLSSTLYNI